jgi:hypothetical protein
VIGFQSDGYTRDLDDWRTREEATSHAPGDDGSQQQGAEDETMKLIIKACMLGAVLTAAAMLLVGAGAFGQADIGGGFVPAKHVGHILLGVDQVGWVELEGVWLDLGYEAALEVYWQMPAASGFAPNDDLMPPDHAVETNWTHNGTEFRLATYKRRTESLAHMMERHQAALEAAWEVFPPDVVGPPVGILELPTLWRRVA